MSAWSARARGSSGRTTGKTFAVDTLGLAGTVRTENNIRLFVTEQDGELYAAQLFSYG